MPRLNLVPAAALSAAVLCAASGARADLTVSTAATKNVTCSSGVCTTTAASANLSASDLMSMLASSNVTLKPGSLSQNIVISASVFWSSTRLLILDSYKSIAIDMPIQLTGNGGLIMTTNDGGTGGTISYDTKANISFMSLTSSLVINNTAFTLENSIAGLASALAANSFKNYALANPYDAKQDGTYTKSPIPTAVISTVDGLNNPVSNLTIDAPSSVTSVGLFAEDDGTIQNFNLTSVNVKSAGNGNDKVGGLAAIVDDEAFAIGDSVSGTVSAPQVWGSVGGLIGDNEGTVDHCLSAAKVTGVDAGGLVGFNDNLITSSTASGAVKVKLYLTHQGVGGGLLGVNQGTVTLSSASASVQGHGHDATVGGLVGVNNGSEVNTSFATGKVKASGGTVNVGGLVGNNNGGDITQSYATGPASGSVEDSNVGGLVGGSSGTISQSYSTGVVTATKQATGGGLIGTDSTEGQGGTLVSDYWDMTTSGIDNPSQGAGEPKNDKGITGLTDSALKSGLPSGFDKSVWAESSKINGGLPYLVGNPPQK
jgi:hypothetical protein